MSVLRGGLKLGLAMVVAFAPLHVAAQEKIWVVDPLLAGQVVHQSVSSDFRFHVIDVVNSLDGSVDSISFDTVTGQWLAIGQDDVILGGTLDPSVLAEVTDAKRRRICPGGAMFLCLPAAVGAICEIRRELAVRRADRACAAAGQGLQVDAQTGCGNVRTTCIPRFPHNLQTP